MRHIFISFGREQNRSTNSFESVKLYIEMLCNDDGKERFKFLIFKAFRILFSSAALLHSVRT